MVYGYFQKEIMKRESIVSMHNFQLLYFILEKVEQCEACTKIAGSVA